MIDNDGCPRIADFGLAKIGLELYDEGPDTYGGQGSLRWQAPELIIANRYKPVLKGATVESDVFAFGHVCLEVGLVICLKTPCIID